MEDKNYKRRSFIKTAGLGGAALATSGLTASPLVSISENILEEKAKVINPYGRVPVSLIIDDSTCLVNLAHYGIPQFAETFPDRYKQDWRKLPREIPDSFVREFGEWCHEQGIRGKYSIVPYPACTGWVNRFIPGWTKRELEDSLNLVRDLIMPDWDIHPEMVSHTRVFDIKTGKPYPNASPEYMENFEWSQTKSADELATYQAFALRVLKDAGLECEGLTTPGGYGGRNKENLAKGTMDALRDVFQTEIPHYFRDLYTEKGKSVAPLVKLASGLDSNDPKCVVSIIGCTEDWFGDWDGLHPGSADLMITEDLSSGRLVDVIDSGEPAIMVCHWPGIYYNGEKVGFNIFKETVKRLNEKYDNLIWMKNSEISRYWAAKELSTLTLSGKKLSVKAPFATKGFTVSLSSAKTKNPKLIYKGEEKPLTRVDSLLKLTDNTWCKNGKEVVLCIDLPKGEVEVML
ncbi:MAG: twin-arginine translocation signal domain-containing protein [Cyclobacteriaceae bacterium]|nr:twin-arginine translocation signal domain-containing protein [Cyclobacteriaceae bacterium]